MKRLTLATIVSLLVLSNVAPVFAAPGDESNKQAKEPAHKAHVIGFFHSKRQVALKPETSEGAQPAVITDPNAGGLGYGTDQFIIGE